MVTVIGDEDVKKYLNFPIRIEINHGNSISSLIDDGLTIYADILK